MLRILHKTLVNIANKQANYYGDRVLSILSTRGYSNKTENPPSLQEQSSNVNTGLAGTQEIFTETTVSHQIENKRLNTLEMFNQIEHSKMKNVPESNVTSESEAEYNSCKPEAMLAVYVGVNAVCWSLLDSKYNLLDWSYLSFLHVSPKNGILSLVQLAHHICSKLPRADIYILETLPAVKVAARKQIVYLEIAQRQQLHLSILTCLTRSNYTNKEETLEFNNIFLLDNKKVTQFFGINLGSEAVSADYIVKSLMSKGFLKDNNYLHVFIEPELREHYKKAGCQEKTQMQHALLMSVFYKYSFEYQ